MVNLPIEYSDKAVNPFGGMALMKRFFDQMNLGAVTVDFDSTVITREGKQEGAAVGYNPNHRGRALLSQHQRTDLWAEELGRDL